MAIVLGKRVSIMGFPLRWHMGDGSAVWHVAQIEEAELNPVSPWVCKYGVF